MIYTYLYLWTRFSNINFCVLFCVCDNIFIKHLPNNLISQRFKIKFIFTWANFISEIHFLIGLLNFTKLYNTFVTNVWTNIEHNWNTLPPFINYKFIIFPNKIRNLFTTFLLTAFFSCLTSRLWESSLETRSKQKIFCHEE